MSNKIAQERGEKRIIASGGLEEWGGGRNTGLAETSQDVLE